MQHLNSKNYITNILIVIIVSVGLLISSLMEWKQISILALCGFASIIVYLLCSRKYLSVNIIDLIILGFILYVSIQSLLLPNSYSSNLFWLKILTLLSLYILGKASESNFFLTTLFMSLLGIVASVFHLFHNSGHIGAYLAICIANLICTILSIKDKKLRVLCILLCTINLFLFLSIPSLSRNGLLLIIISFALSLYAYMLNERFKNHIRDSIIFILIAMFSVAALYMVRPLSAQSRILVWNVSAHAFLKHPLFGYGIESFKSLYMLWQADYFSHNIDSQLIPLATNQYQAYNEFIRILCEYGIAGFAMICTIIYLAIRKGKTTLLKLSLISILLASSFLYTSDILAIYILIPIVVGKISSEVPSFELGKKYVETFNDRAMHWIKYASVAIFITLIGLGFYNYKTYKNANAAIAQIGKTLNSRDTLTTEEFATAVSSDFTKMSMHNNAIFSSIKLSILYSKCISISEDYSQKLYVFESAMKRVPTIELALNIGLIEYERQDYIKAEKYLLLAHNMAPERFRAMSLLMDLYIATKQNKRAIEIAETIVNTSPRIYNGIVVEVKHKASEFLKRGNVL